MTSTARQLRQPPAIEAIERVPYFPDVKSIARRSKNGYIQKLRSKVYPKKYSRAFYRRFL